MEFPHLGPWEVLICSLTIYFPICFTKHHVTGDLIMGIWLALLGTWAAGGDPSKLEPHPLATGASLWFMSAGWFSAGLLRRRQEFTLDGLTPFTGNPIETIRQLGFLSWNSRSPIMVRERRRFLGIPFSIYYGQLRSRPQEEHWDVSLVPAWWRRAPLLKAAFGKDDGRRWVPDVPNAPDPQGEEKEAHDRLRSLISQAYAWQESRIKRPATTPAR